MRRRDPLKLERRFGNSVVGCSAAAIALASIALWPAFVSRGVTEARASALPTMAPVTADYRNRDRLIAFWEGAVREHHPEDMLSPRQLADQYLQRYRERGDLDDVLRAEHAAKQSLQAQPRGNTGGALVLASIFLTLHRFSEALALTKQLERADPGDPQMLIREASLDLELGRYAEAERIFDALPRVEAKWPGPAGSDIPGDTVRARWLELSGHLGEARRLLERPTAYQNAYFDAPAQQRAWFYFRSGELAFEAGDNDAALQDETEALRIFPDYADALRVRARVACALHRWQACLADATRSANVVPYPETLGYQADAQRGLGDDAAAKQTDDLIRTIERIGNAQHVSDRLLATYYAEHRMYPDDAYRIALGELKVRDDIFTEDTLAWAAAMDGHWNEGRTAIGKALRFDTENALLHYHAGMIALHFGDRAEAKRQLARALALNSHFHPAYADDARSQLARL